MRMKIIFIDIDGPLAWATWNEGRVKIRKGDYEEFTIPYSWVREDCDALMEIINLTNASLVVSSDWRKHFSFLQLGMIFEEYGIHRYHLLDTTTHFNPRKKLSSSHEWDRACEIQSWVKTFKPTNWIAIDDMNLSHGFKSMRIAKWRHIQVDGDFGYGGRLRDKVKECVEKLNKD